MNPFLPPNEFIPDPEARVWADGRLYVYGSRDQPSVEDYCSGQYKVFSTADLIHWTDHGVSFDAAQIPFSNARTLYAPDCVFHQGRYHLFFCLPDGREGVAVAGHPAGPFVDPVPVAGADGLGIDPAALVDDDGKVYLYWGQNSLYAAQLTDDLRAIVPDTLHTDVLTHAMHGFHEGASIRKIHNRYCMVYCDGVRGRATSLSYAWSDSPFGPFERGGVIIDNTNCDPLSWNIHGSLCQFRGQWYIFYHRSSGNSRYNRRACVEPVTILPDGTIHEVQMTTTGAGPVPCAANGVEAWRACSLYGRIHVARDGATDFLRSCGQGNIADFREFSFAGETHVRVTAKGRGRLLLNPGSIAGSSLAVIEFDATDAWTTIELPMLHVLHSSSSLHLFFLDGSIDITRFDFVRRP